MCQRFCYCFDMLAFHICGVYFNFLNIYRQIEWPTTGNLSAILMRADFRCQLLCRLLIRRLQRVLRLSHFCLTQRRISESILSMDNETNGTSGIKCNFVCNWKSTCSFWWSLLFFFHRPLLEWSKEVSRATLPKGPYSPQWDLPRSFLWI